MGLNTGTACDPETDCDAALAMELTAVLPLPASPTAEDSLLVADCVWLVEV
jgi:hypothetical protein